MIDNPQTLASLSPAFADALQNSRHALLTEDPAESLARVLTTFHNEHRAEVLRDAEEICDEAGASYTNRALNDHADAAYTLMERFRRKAEEAEQTAVLPAVPVPPTTQATATDGPVNDMRELYGIQHAIRDAGGELTRDVHKAIDALREAWDREVRGLQGELRRLADEAQQQPDTETRCTCGVAGDAFVPLGHYADCPQAAAVSGPGAAGDKQDEADEVVHGCPPDGSGLTPCCGRTPFELPRTDRISSEAPVTCRGAKS